MSHYSFKKDILSHSFLHYFTQEAQPEGSFLSSILSVIVIVLEMMKGNRILKQETDDIIVQRLEHEHYWYMLENETPVNEASTIVSEVEQVLEKESLFLIGLLRDRLSLLPFA